MGNKNSGRKSAMVEFKDKCLLTMTTSWLLENFYKMSDDKKLEVALKIAPKGISEKIEHSGSIEGTQINITMVKATNDRSELPNNATPSRSVQIPHR